MPGGHNASGMTIWDPLNEPTGKQPVIRDPNALTDIFTETK